MQIVHRKVGLYEQISVILKDLFVTGKIAIQILFKKIFVLTVVLIYKVAQRNPSTHLVYEENNPAKSILPVTSFVCQFVKISLYF